MNCWMKQSLKKNREWSPPAGDVVLKYGVALMRLCRFFLFWNGVPIENGLIDMRCRWRANVI